MQTLLYAKILRGKKDAVAFRERARQTARLLRFAPTDQPTIAAAAFVVAYQALTELIRPRLVLGIDQGALRIQAQGKRRSRLMGGQHGMPGASRFGLPVENPLYHFVKALPSGLELDAADLALIIAQVHRPRTTDLFEEINQQNQELLALAHALVERDQELAQVRGVQKNPSAA